MLRKVKLYGQLAKFVGHRVLEADVHNAAEAVRFLVANWPELEAHMANQHYRVSVGNWEISEEELHYPTNSDIKIIPVVSGAGGTTGKILLGVALIGASFLLPGAGIFGTTSLTGVSAAGTAAASGVTVGGAFLTGVGTVMSGIGASLVLSGVADMLTPVPQTPETVQDPQNSFSFSGLQNTSRAGVCVPVIYGEVITGSVVISAAVDTVQVEA